MFNIDRFPTFKVIEAFDINGEFIAFVKVDNRNGFYDFIDSVVVEDIDEFIDSHLPIE